MSLDLIKSKLNCDYYLSFFCSNSLLALGKGTSVIFLVKYTFFKRPNCDYVINVISEKLLNLASQFVLFIQIVW